MEKKKIQKVPKTEKSFCKILQKCSKFNFSKNKKNWKKKIPVQLELHLDPKILPIFEAEILDNAGGQPQVQYGLARVLNCRQVGYAFLTILVICGFFYVILTVFAFQK